eukprot:1933148-Pyramimonas_sp.AAC.1
MPLAPPGQDNEQPPRRLVAVSTHLWRRRRRGASRLISIYPSSHIPWAGLLKAEILNSATV